MATRRVTAAIVSVIAAVAVTGASNSVAFAAEPTDSANAASQVVLEVDERFRANYLLDSPVTVAVAPADYNGKISAMRRGEEIASSVAANGQAELSIPAEKLGSFRVRIVAADAPGFTGTAVPILMVSSGVRLRKGDRHPVVPKLVQHLSKSKYLVPRAGKRYSPAVSDVVMAFQKVHDLPRTGRMNRQTWQKLAKSGRVQPRFRGRGIHLEVDKTRQIMMLVRNGKVRATLHVSTGKTGNTPEGRYPIFAKGIGSLYRFMSFKGNFGIHGYVPVPAQPASAGCVREPMWAADWFYNRTPMGASIYIYR